MNTCTNPSGYRVSLVAMLAVLVGTLLVPSITLAQTSKEKSRQNDKNLMRNLGIGAGAAAVYEGVKGHKTSALLLGAGALYAGKKYEDARKAQNKDKPHYAYSSVHHRINHGKRSPQWHQEYQHHDRDHHDQGLHRGWDKHRGKHGDHH